MVQNQCNFVCSRSSKRSNHPIPLVSKGAKQIGQVHQLANVLCNKLGQCFQSTTCCDCNVDVELFADIFQTLVNFAKFSNVAIEQSCKTVDVDFFDIEVSGKHTLDKGKDILFRMGIEL